MACSLKIDIEKFNGILSFGSLNGTYPFISITVGFCESYNNFDGYVQGKMGKNLKEGNDFYPNLPCELSIY
jgi:hypothetical protein